MADAESQQILHLLYVIPCTPCLARTDASSGSGPSRRHRNSSFPNEAVRFFSQTSDYQANKVTLTLTNPLVSLNPSCVRLLIGNLTTILDCFICDIYRSKCLTNVTCLPSGISILINTTNLQYRYLSKLSDTYCEDAKMP